MTIYIYIGEVFQSINLSYALWPWGKSVSYYFVDKMLPSSTIATIAKTSTNHDIDAYDSS